MGVLLFIGLAWVASGQISPALACASLSQALLITALLYINQFPDRRADTLAGKRHWVARLSLPAAARGYTWLTSLAYGVLVLGVWHQLLPLTALCGLATLPASLLASAQLRQHADQPAALRPAIIATLLAANLHPLCLALGLAWPV